MRPFTFTACRTPAEAFARTTGNPSAAFIAGGTDLLQLLKERVACPDEVVDINGLPWSGIDLSDDGIRIGALARMSDVADDGLVHERWPVLAEALLASASPQVRNMATIGGNLLQRTRCLYFRDATMPCNKRIPGSGCPAWDGQNRINAILGGSPGCIATHPSDLAVALMALDASVSVEGADGPRDVPIGQFYRLPGDSPNVETTLRQGELITQVFVPDLPSARRSHYLKVRDRASFEWALVSCAVAVDLASDGLIRDARIAVGGVATSPWRLPQVEAALRGARSDDLAIRTAADKAAEGAHPREHNAFKVDLMKRTIVRALKTMMEDAG